MQQLWCKTCSIGSLKYKNLKLQKEEEKKKPSLLVLASSAYTKNNLGRCTSDLHTHPQLGSEVSSAKSIPMLLMSN